mgnify:CR=1 FL=1
MTAVCACTLRTGVGPLILGEARKRYGRRHPYVVSAAVLGLFQLLSIKFERLSMLTCALRMHERARNQRPTCGRALIC